jgi:hypothetical protein
MAYLGKNQTPNTVQIYDGYKWVEYEDLSFQDGYDGYSADRALFVNGNTFGYTLDYNSHVSSVKNIISPIILGDLCEPSASISVNPSYCSSKCYIKFDSVNMPTTIRVALPAQVGGLNIIGDKLIKAITTVIVRESSTATYANFISTWFSEGTNIDTTGISARIFGSTNISLTSLTTTRGSLEYPTISITTTSITGLQHVILEIDYSIM